jgi:hypothetical protein
LTPPADLLQRDEKPRIPVEAATSEDAYEDWREDVNDWADASAAIIDRACKWFEDAGIETLLCTPRPPVSDE